MSATTAQTRARRPYALTLTGAGALVAGTMTAIAAPVSPVAADPISSTSGSADAVCSLTEYDGVPYVECEVTSSGHLDLVDDLDVLTMDLAPDTPVTITARGGAGGSFLHWGSGGSGGTARTVVDYASVSDGIEVTLGRDAQLWRSQTEGRFAGGASTVVTTRSLQDGASMDDVIVVAGGGGAQGVRYQNGLCEFGGGNGGAGGSADASTSDVPVTGKGGDGVDGYSLWLFCEHNGKRGYGGNGSGGGSVAGTSRAGSDGLGGLGGDTTWVGVPSLDNWADGRGGRGGDAQGGGGWGGGGAATRGSGAGGGGSYAAAASAIAPATAPALQKNAALVIAWPQPDVDVRTSGAGIVEHHRDGKLVGVVDGAAPVIVPDGVVVLTEHSALVPARGTALVARANPGQSFVGWEGSGNGSATQVVHVGGGELFDASFTLDQPIATAGPNGRITVTASDGSAVCTSVVSCAAPHRAGDEFTVTATADPIADHVGWNGVEGEVGSTIEWTATPDMVPQARFDVPTVPVHLRVEGATTAWITQDGRAVCGWLAGPYACRVDIPERGGPVTFAHAQQYGAEFSGWSGVCSSQSPTCTVDPRDGSQTLVARFIDND